MTGRRRITWLLDSTEPTGRAVMAARRMQVLGDRHSVAGIALSGRLGPAPAGTPLAVLRRGGTLAAEARIMRSDVLVTTSYGTIGSAVPRMTPGTRLIHFVHGRPEQTLGAWRFMRATPALAHVVVPVSVDPAEFARHAGLPVDRVSALDDFTTDAASLLGPATGTVAVLAGRMGRDSNVLDVVEGFRLASDRLPGWQLRILGGGVGADEVAEHVEAAGLDDRVLVLGGVHDTDRHYLDAGLVIRVDPADVNGLSVLEGLAAGVPVLGSPEVPAVRRFVRHGHNGIVLERTDPASVADGLVRLADPTLRAALAAHARTDRTGLLTATAAAELHALVERVLARPVPEGASR